MQITTMKKLKLLCSILSLQLLEGCSGGSAVSSITSSVDSFKNAQYARSSLYQIQAAEGYSAIETYKNQYFTDTYGPGSGIKIGLIDTGINYNHESLSGQYRLGRVYNKDTENEIPNTSVTDSAGHGTKVASLIVGKRDNSNQAGIYGVAYGAKITPYAVQNATGTNDSISDVMYTDAVNDGNSVINLSFETASAGYQTALLSDYVRTKNIAFVAASGNAGLSEPNNPAALAGTINSSSNPGVMLAVTSVTSSNLLSSFSNYCGSAKLYCLAAPGESVTVAQNTGGYTTGSGTSFSAPLVSGSIAVLMSAFPSLSANQAAKFILRGAVPIDSSRIAGQDVGNDASKLSNKYGWGVLNLKNATNLITGTVVSSAAFSIAQSGMRASSVTASSDIANYSENLTTHDQYGTYQIPLSGTISNQAFQNYQSILDYSISAVAKSPQYNQIGFHEFNLFGQTSLKFGFAGQNIKYQQSNPDNIGYNLNSQNRYFDKFGIFHDLSSQNIQFGNFLISSGNSKIGVNLVNFHQLSNFNDENRNLLNTFNQINTIASGFDILNNNNFNYSASNYGKTNSYSVSQKYGKYNLIYVTTDNANISNQNYNSKDHLFAIETSTDRTSARLEFLHENNGFLGTKSSGAFGTGGANSIFSVLNHKIISNNNGFISASATVGLTDVKTLNGSLFSNFSTIYTYGYGINAKYQNFTINIVSPLSVASGNVTEAMNNKQLSLKSSNEQYNLQLSYIASQNLKLSIARYQNLYGIKSNHITSVMINFGKSL